MRITLKNVSTIIALCVVISCGSKPPNVPAADARAKAASKYAHLLSLYKMVRFDTLHVFSVGLPDSVGYPFTGTVIDSAGLALLPKQVKGSVKGIDTLYACVAFTITDGRLGLVTRVPAEYNSNAVALLILDTAKDEITDFFELSHAWGDAGDFIGKDSWIVNQSINCKVFTWYQQGHDNDADDEKDTSVATINKYFLLGLNDEKHDTLANNTADVARIVKQLVGNNH